MLYCSCINFEVISVWCLRQCKVDEGGIFMKIKGSIWIAALLFIETVIFIKAQYVFPPSIIAWHEEFMVRFLVYWVVHILLLFFIFNRYFLNCREVKYPRLAAVILIFLLIRIVFDIWMCTYIGHKTVIFYFPLARVCLYSEVGMSLLICLLFWGYAKSAGYEVRFRLADWIKVMLSLTGVIFCILGAEYLIQSFWDYELSLEKDTVSYGNVESVYLFNLFFQNIIAFLMNSTLFSVVISREQVAWQRTEEESYGTRKSAKRTTALVLAVVIILLFVSGISILDFL